MNYILKQSTIKNQSLVSPEGGKSQRVVKKGANALSAVNLNALSAINESENTIFNEIKAYYNDKLLQLYTKEQINELIFKDKKERSNHANLIKKLDYQYKSFFDAAYEDKFILENGFLPSMILSQFSKIKAKSIQKKHVFKKNLEVII